MSQRPEEWSPTPLSVAAWVSYDLANTIFALGVQGLYFALWITDVQGWPDRALALAISSAMIVVIPSAPWIGARSDHLGRRRPFLVAATLLAVGGGSLLGSVPALPSLMLFSVALVGFNLGTVVYDAMLPDVSTAHTRGLVSGVGVGVGYLGSFVALVAGRLVLHPFGYPVLFRTLAALFLAFALPAFFLVRERPRPPRRGEPPRLRSVARELVASWQRARSYPGVARFLVGRFLYTDAINTLISGFLAVFAVQEMGFSASQVELLTGTAIVAAIGGGLTGSRLVDRVGPRRFLHAMLTTWMVALAVGIATAVTGVQPLGWLVGAAGGFALGGTWSADRVYMARISPPRHYGEFYGLYATVGRFATVLGPLLWALVADVAGLGRRVAVATLIVYLVGARIVLQPVSDAERSWGEEDRDPSA